MSTNFYIIWKEPVSCCWHEDADLERDRLLLQRLKVATIGSHTGSQAPGWNLESLWAIDSFLSEPPTYYQRKQRSKGWKLDINLSEVVHRHYVGEVGKSVTFVLCIIPVYSVPNNVEIDNICRHYSKMNGIVFWFTLYTNIHAYASEASISPHINNNNNNNRHIYKAP